MKVVVWVLILGGCWRQSSQPPPSEPERKSPPKEAPPTTAGDVGPNTCKSDADCTIGFAGPSCCPPDPFCGAIVSRAQVAKFNAMCGKVDCGPPKPSSSCMGWLGVHAVCTNGACVSSKP